MRQVVIPSPLICSPGWFLPNLQIKWEHLLFQAIRGTEGWTEKAKGAPYPRRLTSCRPTRVGLHTGDGGSTMSVVTDLLIGCARQQVTQSPSDLHSGSPVGAPPPAGGEDTGDQHPSLGTPGWPRGVAITELHFRSSSFMRRSGGRRRKAHPSAGLTHLESTSDPLTPLQTP